MWMVECTVFRARKKRQARKVEGGVLLQAAVAAAVLLHLCSSTISRRRASGEFFQRHRHVWFVDLTGKFFPRKRGRRRWQLGKVDLPKPLKRKEPILLSKRFNLGHATQWVKVFFTRPPPCQVLRGKKIKKKTRPSAMRASVRACALGKPNE